MNPVKRMPAQSIVHERPILFSTPMVRAILENRKTQTRRVVKADAVRLPNGDGAPFQVGTSLWVRETWGYRGGVWRSHFPHVETVCIGYRADDSRLDYELPDGASQSIHKQKPQYKGEDMHERNDYLSRYWNSWRPSIHMPRWASRITLEITDVRVHRLQEISEEDAEAEGWTKRPNLSSNPEVHREAARDWFMDLWDSINAKKYPWSANPWVWCVCFRRVQ